MVRRRGRDRRAAAARPAAAGPRGRPSVACGAGPTARPGARAVAAVRERPVLAFAVARAGRARTPRWSAVMVMTPLHMEHGGAELRVIGIVISVHVLGMFAFSPLVGMLADRIGRPTVLRRAARCCCSSRWCCARLAPEGSSWQIFVGAVPARAGLVVRDRRRLDADRRPRAAGARTDVQGAADLVMGADRRRGRRRWPALVVGAVGLPGRSRSARPAWWSLVAIAGFGARADHAVRQSEPHDASQTSPSSAAPASTRSSTTPRSTSSRRRTAPRPRRSRSARSPAAGWRSCPGTARTTSYPPHAIHYRANLWALRSLGVRQVLAPVRGRRPARRRSRPGDVVVPDQLVDRTYRRVAVVRRDRRGAPAVRRPVLPGRLRGAVAGADADVQAGGTMVVIEGPRFSTRAESRHYAAQGWTLINMTGAPEAALAREHAAVLRRDRTGHRHGRRRRVRRRASARRRSSRCSAPTSSGSPACSTDAIARPARPRRLHLLDLGRRPRADLRGPGAA